MPDSDEPAPARRKRATGRSRPAGTTTAADEAPAAADEAATAAGEPRTEADEAVAERERHAELERLRHKLHRKFH